MKFNPPLAVVEVQAVFPEFAPIAMIPNGIGGQGVVFRGHVNGSDIALKIFYPGATSERTEREFQFLERAKCPNLAAIHSFGETVVRGEKCIYSATPFIDGQLLAQLIKGNPQSVNMCARLACDIARAIETMWADRVVHRDIKPPNIIVSRNGSAVLFDLGVARHLAMESLTSVGKTWGTQGYMAPEQARAIRLLSCKADIFALGIVIQESLLGRHPVNFDQRLLLNGGLPSSKLVAGLPPEVAAIIDTMMARESHKRPTPSQVMETFSRWL